MSEQNLVYKIENQVCKIIINRPEKSNSINAELIHQLREAFENAVVDPAVRVVLLCANGKHFSAGADLNWMKDSIKLTRAENISDAKQLAKLLKIIYECPKPTLGAIQGKVYGGAVGIVAALDFTVALEDSKFCCSETLLGLVPAMVSPYILRTIGEKAARELFLSAREFSAQEAKELGLVNQVSSRSQLETIIDNQTKLLCKACPVAQAKAKELLRKISNVQIDQNVIDYTAELIADLRTSKTAQERLSNFLKSK